MRRVFRVMVLVLGLVVMAGLCWYFLRPAGRRIQGRTEHQWIASLANAPTGLDIEKWRALGPDAPPILARALGLGTSPIQRWYQDHWYSLPLIARKHLSMPRDAVNIRRNAPLVLCMLTNDISAATPALGQALHDDDPNVRENVALCLNKVVPKLGEKKLRLVPDLLLAMQDTNHLVRENVTQCLGDCPERSRVIAPVLVRACSDQVQFNRYLAVRSLTRMNLDAVDRDELAPMLLNCLTNNDWMVCLNAAKLLSQMKHNPRAEVAAFTQMLGDYRPGKQALAATALGRYGPQASNAIPALRHALETGRPPVREAASNALAQIER